LFFGLVAVIGTTFVQTASVESLAIAAAIPVGALATAILVVNNLRDIDQDREAGKRTLAVRLGRTGVRGEWVGLVAIAYAIPFVLLWVFNTSPWVLLTLLSLPRAISLGRTIRTSEDGATLNAALAGTAQLGFLYSLLLAIGLCV